MARPLCILYPDHAKDASLTDGGKGILCAWRGARYVETVPESVTEDMLSRTSVLVS